MFDKELASQIYKRTQKKSLKLDIKKNNLIGSEKGSEWSWGLKGGMSFNSNTLISDLL